MADYTYEELQRFRLVDRDGNVTDYRIPTLAEVLEWGKDKVAFNFENKYINTKGVGEAERRRALDYYVEQLLPGGAWSEYHNIFLSVRSLDEALALFPDDEELFIIGGAQIYEQALPLADRLYLTRVCHPYEGDTSFPEWDASEWHLASSEAHPSGREYPHPFVFERWERRRPGRQ